MVRKVYSIDGSIVGEVQLPSVFEAEIRPDVIRRVYLSILTASIQPQGRDRYAGLRTSAESWGVGHGVARVPRVKGRGYPAAGRAARANQAVKGVRVGAPRVEKVILERVNKKEKRLGIISALAATASIELVSKRHRLDGVEEVPIIMTDDIEEMKKTRDVEGILMKIGLQNELKRLKKRFKKIRAGKGKYRGRIRKRARGPLFIVLKEDAFLRLAARNIPGVDVVPVRNLSVMDLAPGGVPGRLTIWSRSSLDFLSRVVG
ncbi:MAG: 50S ribosomal protein L4 [Candidatus Methanodesulfokora sp.]|nr:MAG: 50S ribosomal protein L4 [Candidatus Korarchaeota archaeon]